MKNIIDRIEEIDAQIKSLQLIIDKGEYLATGLTIEVSLGANAKSKVPIQLGAYSNVEKVVLQNLVTGLSATRNQYVDDLKKLVVKAKEILEKSEQP